MFRKEEGTYFGDDMNIQARQLYLISSSVMRDLNIADRWKTSS